MNGWLILDKPTGMSSAQAVAKVKRLIKPKKIGHAGTLDPPASGVLPLAIGEATKTINHMMDTAKGYGFTVSWGEKRDTDDAEGQVIASSAKRPLKNQIEAILGRFIGSIEQMPPQYSALKVEGRRAYDLARQGQEAALKPRKVQIHSLKLVIPSEAEGSLRSFDSPKGLAQDDKQPVDSSSFICECGKGTYIRAIARDMGELLGCHGYVSALRRLSVGKFSENDAISLENLEKIVHKGGLSLLPVESALDDILALDIDSSQAMRLKRGQTVPVTLVSNETVLAREAGKAVAICSVSQGTMKPVRVFNL